MVNRNKFEALIVFLNQDILFVPITIYNPQIQHRYFLNLFDIKLSFTPIPDHSLTFHKFL